MPQSMTKPNAILPSSTTSTSSQYPSMLPDPSSYGQNFSQLLNNRGIRFTHSRAISCPNVNTLDDSNADPLCPFCDGSGILYYNPKDIVGVFHSNSIEKNFEYMGVWEIGNAMITFPQEYVDGTQAEFATYDKLQVLDYTVRLYEKKEYEPRTGNLQQLRYPIEKMDYLATVTDDAIKEFIQGVDFEIVSGNIQWYPGHTPTYDPISGRGQVYAASYFAYPIYIVFQPLRELRVTQQMGPDGIKRSIRLPQQVIARRDYFVNSPEKIQK